MSKSFKTSSKLLRITLFFLSLVLLTTMMTLVMPSANAAVDSYTYKNGYYYKNGSIITTKPEDDLVIHVGDTVTFYLSHRYDSIEKNEWGTTDKTVVSLVYRGYSGQNRCDLTAEKVGYCKVTGYVVSYSPGGKIGYDGNGFPIYSDPQYSYSLKRFHIRVVANSSSGSTPTKTTTLKTPQISKIENIASGQRVSWTWVSGAVKYRVFIKSSGSWKKLTDTTSTTFVNKSVSSGKKYYYTVRCITANGKKFTSSYNKSGKAGIFIAQPTIKSFTNTSSGVRINIGTVKGAARYRVFLKSGGSWKKLADTKSSSYLHKVKNGNTYTYTVRAMNSGGKLCSAYNKTGWSHKAPATVLAQPSIKSFINSSAGVTINIAAVKGAAKYRVFVKLNGSWKKLGDTASTSYLHKVTNGNMYTYTVRCLDKKGKFCSSYNSAGWSHKAPATALAQPYIKSFINSSAGVTINIATVKGAAKYRVFVKLNGLWKKLGDTASTSYLHKVTNGDTYTYTVRCLDKKGKFCSSYNSAGWSHTAPATALAQPYIKSFINSSTGVTINIAAVKGAAKYRVFVKLNGSWKKLGDTASTSYLHKVTNGNTYTYTVRCLDKNGKFCSSYNSAGWSHTAPKPAAIQVTSKSYFKANKIVSEKIIQADNSNYYNVINNSKVISCSSSSATVQVQRYTLVKQPANRDNTVYVEIKTSYVIDSSNDLYYCNTTGTTKIASNVKSVFVSPGNFYGYITTSNDLYMCGNNYYGQIGVGDRNLNTNGVTRPTKVLSNVKTVSLGRSHAAAVLNNGDLYTWGCNISGEIGNGTVNSAGVHSPTKIMSNVKTVSAGNHCTAAVTNSGILYTWGANECGQLGDKTYTNKEAPVKIMSGIKDVKMFEERVGALSESNQLYTWGHNNGQSTDYIKSSVPRVLANSIKAFYIGDSYCYYINNASDIYLYSFQFANKINHEWYETFTPKKLSLCE